MHSLQEMLDEVRRDTALCQAIERNGIFCYNERVRDKQGHLGGKYCVKHKSRFYKTGSINLLINKESKCKFIDCNNKVKSKNLCKKHYAKYGKFKKVKCSIEECKKFSIAKTFCPKHYARFRKSGNPNEVGARYLPFEKGLIPYNKGCFKYDKCIAPGCTFIPKGKRREIRKGLCPKHRTRWERYNDYNIASKKEYEEKLKTN